MNLKTAYDSGSDPQGNIFKRFLADYEKKAQDVLRETTTKFTEEIDVPQETIPNR
jgi:hypothetical protein